MFMKLTIALFFPLLLGTCLTSCRSIHDAAVGLGWANQPDEPPSNSYLDKDAVKAIERVVLMPMHAPETDLATRADLDRLFHSKLNATQLFEVVVITRESLLHRFSHESFDSSGRISQGLLDYLASSTKADAVLMTDLTGFHPYAPIQIGIRAKLVRFDDQSIIWAIDEVFDAASKTTSDQARAYEKRHIASFDKNHRYEGILVSPNRFSGFAMERCLLTLPPNTLSRNF
jgi:hypothetical protein